MNPINTALLSFGASGRYFHAPFLETHPGFSLQGCLQRSNDRFSSRYPGKRVYRTLEELEQDEQIELVVVNTPNSSHFELALRMLESGKHVVVEKAFTTNGRDARRLLELAKEKNRILTVYHNRRWDGDFLTVRQLVESGRLGNMVDAELHFSRFRPALSAKLHKEMPGPGSGLLLDLGPHLADQAIQLFGIPESVSARLAITRPGSQVDDFFDLALFYPGFTVRLKAGFFVRHLPASFILHGTRGSYLQPRSNIQEEQLMAGKSPLDAGFGIDAEPGKGELFFEDESGSPIKEPITLLPGNYMEFYHRLHAGIRLGSTLPVTSDEAVAVMDLLDAAFASHGSGQVERVRG